MSEGTSWDYIHEPPIREVRRPLLSRGWLYSGVWVSLAARVDLLLRYVDLHRRSHLADLRQRACGQYRQRNERGASVDWRFTTDDARVKLRKLYPSIEP